MIFVIEYCIMKRNLLEDNYRSLMRYSELLQNGEMSEEQFNSKKKELLEDKSWEEEYKKLKGKKAKKYTLPAYVWLIMIYHDYGTVTDEEFKRYSELLLEKTK